MVAKAIENCAGITSTILTAWQTRTRKKEEERNVPTNTLTIWPTKLEFLVTMI